MTGQPGIEALHFANDPLRAGDHLVAGRGRRVALGRALEQPDAEPFLELREPPEDRRVIDPELARGGRQGAGSRDGGDDAKVVLVENLIHCNCAI